MERLSFFTPVTYQPVPNALFNKNLSTYVRELADDFFAWRDGHRAFVIESTDKVQTVQLVNCQKTSVWKTALKIALFFTPLSPIMLLIKLYSRLSTSHHVATYLPPKENRSDWEPVIYKNYSFAKYEEVTRRYTEICKRQGIIYKNASPLEKHVLFFADQDGNISQPSIKSGFERLHSNTIIASVIATTLFNGLADVLKIQTPSFSIKDISKTLHTVDTHVFTANGGFDEKAFQDLLNKYATRPSMVLSAANVEKLRQANVARDKDKPNLEHGIRANTGEFKMMFNLFSDCALVDKFGNTMQAITPGRLKSLYTDGPALFEEVAALPAV